jgi:hypothetical protein
LTKPVIGWLENFEAWHIAVGAYEAWKGGIMNHLYIGSYRDDKLIISECVMDGPDVGKGHHISPGALSYSNCAKPTCLSKTPEQTTQDEAASRSSAGREHNPRADTTQLPNQALSRGRRDGEAPGPSCCFPFASFPHCHWVWATRLSQRSA